MIAKRAEERMGTTWGEGMVLESVAPASPAGRCGVAQYIGWQLCTVDGTPVANPGELLDAALGATRMRIRFARRAPLADVPAAAAHARVRPTPAATTPHRC